MIGGSGLLSHCRDVDEMPWQGLEKPPETPGAAAHLGWSRKELEGPDPQPDRSVWVLSGLEWERKTSILLKTTHWGLFVTAAALAP